MCCEIAYLKCKSILALQNGVAFKNTNEINCFARFDMSILVIFYGMALKLSTETPNAMQAFYS